MLVKERKENFVEAFSNVVNNFLSRKEAQELAQALARDHRTLLQCKMSVALEFIHIMAEDYRRGHYDLRNEASGKVAVKIDDALTPEDFCFPCI